MNALVVYAHPEPTSFTGALKDVSVRALRGAGHAVELSDLHAEGFNPVAGRHDFARDGIDQLLAQAIAGLPVDLAE